MGLKSRFWDGRATANLAAFYYDYKGYQVSTMIDRNSVNINIDAEVMGFEAEVVTRLTDNLSLNASLGLLDSKLDDGEHIDTFDQTGGSPDWLIAKNPETGQNCIVDRAVAETLLSTPFAATAALLCTPGGVSSTIFSLIDDPTTNADDAANLAFAGSLEPESRDGIPVQVGGNSLPRAPDTTLSVGAEYSWDLPEWRISLRGDVYYQTEMYTRIFNLEADRISSWSNANTSLSFDNPNNGISLEFYVKNLFDDDQVTNQYLTDASSGLFTNVFVMDPRRYGVQLTKRW